MLAPRRRVENGCSVRPGGYSAWVYGVLFALWAIALLLANGCGADRGPQRVVVAGTVSFQGEPLPRGEIRFVPAKGSTGPVSVANIIDGKYRADARGGVPVATHQIQIVAYRVNPDGPKQDPQDSHAGPPPTEQYLPAKYNSASELELVVEAGHDDIRKNFELVR